MTDRFDMPELMRDFINTAIRNETIDGVTVWELTSNYGSDFRKMREYIMECAYNQRHSAHNNAHAELCPLANACHQAGI